MEKGRSVNKEWMAYWTNGNKKYPVMLGTLGGRDAWCNLLRWWAGNQPTTYSQLAGWLSCWQAAALQAGQQLVVLAACQAGRPRWPVAGRR